MKGVGGGGGQECINPTFGALHESEGKQVRPQKLSIIQHTNDVFWGLSRAFGFMNVV